METEGRVMKKWLKVLFFCAAMAPLLAASVTLHADPCLVVYPSGPCIYYYDPAVYYTVGPGDSLYDPLYDRGGKMLLMIGTNYLDLSIYQPPNLMGFIAAPDENVGYYFNGTDFTLIIDGFSHSPTTYSNIIVMFDKFVPSSCTPVIFVDGMLVTDAMYYAGDLVVSTPTDYGNNYSDTKALSVSYSGCYGFRIWAFADENYDNVKEAGECFTAYTHDLTIPVKSETWGAIKELFR
jgi:hypothetical protein